MKKFILTALILTGAVTEAYAYNINTKKITTSGISSGSYMAGQLHVALSKVIKGAGLVAGGPYFCSQGSITDALYKCADTLLGSPNPEALSQKAMQLSQEGKIDDVSNLKDAKVFILSGQLDKTVKPKVALANIGFYKNLGVSEEKILVEASLEMGHSFPTMDYGVPCDAASQSPYISRCQYDGAKAILQHLYGPLKPKVSSLEGSLSTISQSQFFNEKLGASISMGDQAFLYTPTACAQGEECALHIVFHGCKQTVDHIGDIFPKNTGYNEWAEANNIIVLYPQAVTSNQNPNGCWDWWGYAGSDYYTKSAPQIQVVQKMIESLIN